MSTLALEAFERLLLPAAVAAMPGRLGASLMRRAARLRKVQRGAGEAARIAMTFGSCVDERAFCERFALYRLLDHADLFLSHTRSFGWFERSTVRSGPVWPVEGAYIAVTFHFGAGMWAMRDLGRHAKGVRWIHAPVTPPHNPVERVVAAVGRARIASVARFAGAPTIPTGGSRRVAEEWLAQGGAVTVLHDAPHFGMRETQEVPFLGRSIHLPTGLAHLAVTTGVPVYFYTTRLELEGFGRRLHVAEPRVFRQPSDFTAAAGRFLEAEVAADPAAWHLWNVLETGFPAPRMPAGMAN